MSDVAQPHPHPHPHPRRRRWLIIGLAVLGVAAAAFIGYALGEGSRDDDVEAAKTQAKQADNQAAKAQKELEQEQAEDEEALTALSQGFQQLGNAIQQQETQDDQAAQAAVDQAGAEPTSRSSARTRAGTSTPR
jgi:hypothetical protein